MKKTYIILVALLITINMCTKKEPSAVLKTGTPPYLLAEKVAEKVPYLIPVKNNALITTRYFDIKSGDVFDAIYTNFGKQANRLSSFGLDQIKNIVMTHARQLAEMNLFLQDAKKMGIQVADSEVDSLIQNNYLSSGDDRLQNWLKENDVSMDRVRQDVHNSLVIQKYLNAVFNREVAITEEEILNLYNEDKYASVRHILITTQADNDSFNQEAKEKISELRQRVLNGEDFAALANQYSEDPGSNQNGGLYENFTHGQMVKPFEDAAFNTPINEISEIVETQYGYHILKPIERKKEEKVYAEVKDQLLETLQNSKRNEVYENLLKNLKSAANYKEIEF
jgi:parvulin-like peptidyl-prolyl isomerase